MSGDTDGVTCAWARCRSVDICCLVPDPAGKGEPLPLCDRHFEQWHLTQNPEERAQLVARLWRGRRRR